MKGDVFKITFPARPDYILAVRLTVSAIAERIGYNIEDIEDIKVACAEACTLLLATRPETIDLQILITDGIELKLDAAGQKAEAAVQDETSELSQYLLEALVDTCELIEHDSLLKQIRISKKL